jgi:hypothetical protein
MQWLNLLFVLLTNGVPLYGVKLLGWSATTVLVLFWFENLLTAVFTCIRIAVHRQLTRKQGHWRPGQLGLLVNGKPSRSGLLGEYATMAFVFTLAHGVFVWGIVVFLGGGHDEAIWQFSAAQFRQGAGWIALTLALNLVVDLAGIKARSYAELKSYVQVRMGRIFVLHFTIILGMFAMLATKSPYAILYLLIAFKTLWELSTTRRGQAKAAAVHASMATPDVQAQGATAAEQRMALEDEQVRPA